MALPVISTAPAAPNRATDSAATFASKADAFVAWMEGAPAEFNAYAAALVDTAAAANYSATSVTSVAIGTGSKSFTVETGKLFVGGQPVRIADAAAPTANYMDGIVSSYNISTGALVVAVSGIGGSGTKASWFVGLTGPQGGAQSANVQTFVESGTWSPPAGTWSTAIVEVWGAGGGGAGGSRRAAGNARLGGGGGGGGAYRRAVFNAADLGSSVVVSIGGPGSGGAGATVNGDGSAGGNGGNTSFGSFLIAYSGRGGGPAIGATGSTGGDGAGVLASGSPTGYAGGVGAAGAAGGNAGDGGGAGGGANAVSPGGAGGGSLRGGAGGGAGGALSSANTLYAVGAGGAQTASSGGAAGGAFQGGPGGAANGAGAGYSGGNGGIAAGGGGGGGGTDANGGAGGRGGAGYCRVILI
jgi:hypothetical protein